MKSNNSSFYGLLATIFSVSLILSPVHAGEQMAAGTPASIPPLQTLLDTAKSARQEKNREKEIYVYSSIIENYPKEKEADIAYFRLARTSFEERNFDHAYSWFEKLISQFPESTYLEEARIGLGLSLASLQRWGDAKQALQAALPSIESSPEKGAVWRTLGEANDHLGNALESIDAFAHCLSAPDGQKELCEDGAGKVVQALASETYLKGIVDRYPKSFPARVALLELARGYKKNADRLNLDRTREKFEAWYPGAGTPKDTFTLPPPPQENHLTIGCILPLSGDLAETATQSLKGIQLAFTMKGTLVEKAHIRLTVKDSGGSHESAAAAIRELTEDKTVVGAVGLFPPGALSAVLTASRGGEVPVIAPSQDANRDLPYIKAKNFHLIGITNESQIRLITDIAINKLAQHSFAVLYPDTDYGRETAKDFVAEAERSGGTIVVSQKYDPSQTDFREQMTALGGKDDQHLRQAIFTFAQEHPDRSVEELNLGLRTLYGGGISYPQITKVKSTPLTKNNFLFEMRVKYDAVFLPATFSEAGLILPTLAFYNISNVQVFGTDRLLSRELVDIGGKYAENVIFTGEFYPENSRVDVKSFVNNFQNAMGEKPGAVAARYYDALMMFFSLIEKGADDRPKLSEAIESLTYYQGVSGTISRSDGNDLKKTPFVFTVEDSRIVEFVPPSKPEAKE